MNLWNCWASSFRSLAFVSCKIHIITISLGYTSVLSTVSEVTYMYAMTIRESYHLPYLRHLSENSYTMHDILPQWLISASCIV